MKLFRSAAERDFHRCSSPTIDPFPPRNTTMPTETRRAYGGKNGKVAKQDECSNRNERKGRPAAN